MSTVTHDITINLPVLHVYAFWKDINNYPLFMENVESVDATGAGTTRWTAKAPDGKEVHWDGRVVAERQGEELAFKWSGATITSYLGVTFEEVAPDQTKVTVKMDYELPESASGGARVTITTDPAEQLTADLNRFKELIENTVAA